MLLMLFVGLIPYQSATVAAGADPCAATLGLPTPPGDRPSPTAVGTVRNAQNSAIAGATMKLFRCQGTQSTPLGLALTDSAGEYRFENINHAGAYFYIAMTGPMAGTPLNSGYSIVSDLYDGAEEWIQFDVSVE
jgi:hypothetical protein